MISHPDKPRARYFRQLKRNVAQPLVKVYPYMRRSFVCLLLAAVIAGLAVFRSPSALAQSGSWTTKTLMPEAREQSASAAFGGLFYIFGGSSSTVPEVYDPLSNSWSTRGRTPSGRRWPEARAGTPTRPPGPCGRATRARWPRAPPTDRDRAP